MHGTTINYSHPYLRASRAAVIEYFTRAQNVSTLYAQYTLGANCTGFADN